MGRLWLGLVVAQLIMAGGLAVVSRHPNTVADWFASNKAFERFYSFAVMNSGDTPEWVKQADVMAGNSVTAILGKLGLVRVERSEGSIEDGQLGSVFEGVPAMHTINNGNRLFDFESELKGKVVLITNVACACGHTQSNYDELNALYSEFSDGTNRFEILGFPTNEFMQEPGSAEDIASFLKQHQVRFPVMAKSLVNGPRANPVYQQLRRVLGGGSGDSDVLWNFETKFLVSSDGRRVQRFSKAFSPRQLRGEIEAELNK